MTRTAHTAPRTDAQETTVTLALAHVVLDLDAARACDPTASCRSVKAYRKRRPVLPAVPVQWLSILRAFAGLSLLTAAGLLLG